MAVIECMKCEWRVQQDEVWDERVEERAIETGHLVFKVRRGVHIDGSDV